VLYLRLERWPELEKIVAELEQHAPLDAAIMRARMLLAHNEFAAARHLLDEILRQEPDELRAKVMLSYLLVLSGDDAAAEPLLRRIVELDPGDAGSWRNLVALYRRQERLAEALSAVQSARLRCPLDPDLLMLHGILLFKTGDWINAEKLLLSVLEREGHDKAAQERRHAVHTHLILLYRRLGRRYEADVHLRALAADMKEQGQGNSMAFLQPRYPTNGHLRDDLAP